MLQWLVGKQIDLIGQTLEHFQEQGADQQDVASQQAVAARSRASEALQNLTLTEPSVHVDMRSYVSR